MINIALDGPSGSGKSTIAKILAKKLNIAYLDTGAMYRTIGLGAIKYGADTKSEAEVIAVLPKIDFKVGFEADGQHVYLDGEDVSGLIRTPQADMASSNVSRYEAVRTYLVEMQRNIARNVDMVLDGRDIGTVVLPDANYKFFLTASPEIRAKRRFDERKDKNPDLKFEDVLREVNERDYQDSNRAISPLRQAEDAVLIDTGDMTIDEVAQTIISFIKEK
ncbi:MAG: (d)CMP kinase [Clostridiales bacterium]|nr:(d)CMP kinase [Clostridiales bacterium]